MLGPERKRPPLKSIQLSWICGDSGIHCLTHVRNAEHYDVIRPLMEKIFCMPASSAPAERVFTSTGVIVRPHHTRIGDDFLSARV